MPPPLIPRSILFGGSSRLQPSLSPDGRNVAYLAADDAGVLNVWCGDWLTRDFRLVSAGQRDIRDYRWSSDGKRILYTQDRNGDENTHVHAIDLAGGEGARNLTPFDGVQARLIALDAEIPGQALVAMNLRTPELHDVYRLDLDTGELAEEVRNPGLHRWVADRGLVVRGAVAERQDGLAIMVRDGASGAWRVLHTAGADDIRMTRPIGFAADGRELIILSSADSDTARLLRVDVASGAVSVLYEDPRHDVIGAGLNPVTGHPDHVVVQRERTEVEPLDPALEADLRKLSGRRDGVVSVLSRDRADRTWLIRDGADDTSPAYHLYDRDTGAVTFLFAQLPQLRPYPLAPVEPFSFTARDGLTIHGYLTFPPQASRTCLPTVLSVHGGPWLRSIWGFRAERQWLANRGYLCAEVNFRGSVGYGKRFMNAGNREWGGRMQDDLTDTVAHLITRGHANPDRIAIMGSSYGGYAALAGAAFTPDLYRCAIAMAAPSNLATFVQSVPAYWRPRASQLDRRIGDPATEPQFLWSRSPLSRADRITIPILIGHGANDRRVPRREAEQIVAELRARGIPHEYVLFPDEGHGLAKPGNRLAFHARAERFLARYIGGRCEDPAQSSADSAVGE